MPYALISDVSGRLPWVEITAGSKPNTTQVQALIDRAARILDQVLLAAGLPAPYSGTGPEAVLGDVVLDYVEGHVRNAVTSTYADENNQDGETALARWEAKLKDIRVNTEAWAEKLAGSSSAGVRHMKSHVLDDPDFDDEDIFFTRDMEL